MSDQRFMKLNKNLLDSFDKNKVKCEGCGKYIDKEKACITPRITRHYETLANRPDISRVTILYWCKESFNDCTKLYSEPIQNLALFRFSSQ
jgi:hypothetical protein